MTKQTRRRFSPEYKEQSVARLSEPGATHSSVAAELGPRSYQRLDPVGGALRRLAELVNSGGIMHHARRPGGSVAAAQNCDTHVPLSVIARGGRCTAWSFMRRFVWRLSMRV